MKSFKEFLLNRFRRTGFFRSDYKKMRDFTYHHVTNPDKDHPTIKKMFVKKFGAHNLKHFDRHVSAIVDEYDPEAKK